MKALSTILSRIASPFREFGARAGLIYAIDRVLGSVLPGFRLYCYELMVQPIPEGNLIGARLMEQLELRELKRGDPEIALMPAREDIKETRFAQNALCLGAFRKGQFIGYLWFSFGRYEEDEVRCTYVLSPPEQAVFDFDLYIFPEHRLGLAFVGIWNAANKFLRGRGIRYTFSRLTRFNLPSRRAHAHLGWKKVADAVFVQAGPIEIMLANRSPYFHASVRRSTRVRLALDPDVLTLPPEGAEQAQKQLGVTRT